MTTVLGARHGEVRNPGEVIYAGLAGYSLSDLGREQARAAAEALRNVGVTALYSSPLDRAVETATAIADVTGLDVAIDERLHEWRYWTRWAGRTWDELRASAPDEWEAYTTAPGSVTHVESLDELASRVTSWLDDAVAAHPHGVVVAVSHLEPLRAALLRLTGRPSNDLFAIEIGLGGIVRLHPHPLARTLDPASLASAIA